ncbi:MAG: DUF4838 domain-containing protein [Clostridia bacterium]|nr:DUF4838 domain-containing protein [Clostridia bacterium]
MNTVNKNEDRVISFASDELRQYLLLGGLTPGQLPVIRLSVRDASAWDAFSCEAAADAITICGTNPRSVLIGCYAYLKRLGFRFLAPGANHTVIPSLDGPSSLTVSRFEEKADCFHRGVCIEGSMSQENLLDYIEWMPKAGLNACFLQFFRPDVFFTRWYRHENNPLLPAEELTEDRLAAMDRCVTEACTRRGLMIHRVGHGWTSRALGYSGNGWQREPEPTDPVLRRRIAQLKGERKLFGGVPANTNLCYSCPDVRDALIREVCEYASAHPETDYLHFWLADTHNNVCECEDCRRTTLSDQYVEILNALDEALTERGLTTRIVFLLYQELLYPPKLTRFRHPERFTMMFAPISRTFESSYPEKVDDTRIVPWVRNHMHLPVGIDENLAFYRQWREVFKGDAFIYDYHLGRAHYGDLGYMTIARTLHRDLQRLHVLGFSGMVACQ